MLSQIGRLALSLHLGGSRKDALTNVMAFIALGSGILTTIVESGLLPDKYQSIAISALSIAGGIIGAASGRSPDLRSVDKKELQ